MKLDMPFDEALERFIGVKPKEMHDNIKRSKKKRPPGGKAPSDGQVDDDKNVVSLRQQRMRRRNGR